MKKYLLICIIILNIFSINAFAAEQDLTVSVSGTEYASPGNTVKICIKAEMNKETALQGVQVDYEMSDNLKNVQDIEFSVTENTTGWETVGLSGKNLLGVGKPIEADSVLNGEISFTVPQNAANGTEYVVHIKEAVGADKDKEISAYVKNNTYTVKVMNETGNFGGAGSNSSLGKSETKSIPISVTDYSDKNELRFTDVKETDWFYDAVKFAFENGITSGVSETEFAPLGIVTRGQFITMLCRAYKVPEMTGDNFSDCGNTWYTGYLAAAKQLGISNGVGDNMFAPKKEITREEMVTLIYNYLKSIGEAEGEFGDTQFADDYLISDWAKAGVAFASEKGYVNGKGNNTFDPKGKATRAELAQVFNNIFK